MTALTGLRNVGVDQTYRFYFQGPIISCWLKDYELEDLQGSLV